MSKVKITLNGIVDTIETNNNYSILANALSQHLELPHSCRRGSCTTCIAQVTKGKTVHHGDVLLYPEQRKNNYILSCMAHAVSDEVEITFDI